MSGGSFVGLTLLSMAWLFFVLGAVTNFSLAARGPRLLLPLFLDVYCIGGTLLFLVSGRTRQDGAR